MTYTHQLIALYLDIDNGYNGIIDKTRGFTNVKLKNDSKHLLETKLYHFFRTHLEQLAHYFTYVNKDTASNEMQSRGILCNVLEYHGEITAKQQWTFIDNELDTMVILNSNDILNSKQIEWFDKTNLLLTKSNSYFKNIEGQLNFLDQVLEYAFKGANKDNFTFEKGYSKLEEERLQKYVEIIEGKKGEVITLQGKLKEAAKTAKTVYTDRIKEFQRRLAYVEQESLLEKRHTEYVHCVNILKNIVTNVKEVHEKIESIERDFTGIKSGIINVEYAIYSVQANIDVVEQYITAIKNRKSLQTEIEESFKQLKDCETEYTNYYGKFKEFYRFKEYFKTVLCESFNTRIRYLQVLIPRQACPKQEMS